MKRWELLLAIAGIACILFGVHSIRAGMRDISRQDSVIADAGCRTPLTILAPKGKQTYGSAIVFHGLSANRRIMQPFGIEFASSGMRAYLIDLPGHGDNTDAFTFLRAEQCAAAAMESLTRSAQIDPKTTVLIGHSMGGAIAIRMADHDPVAATIAISPGPMILPQRMPANLLVFSAQLDLGVLKRQAERLERAAAGTRTQPDDFVEDRAFELDHIPHATHTSLLANPHVITRSLIWAQEAVHPGSVDVNTAAEWNLPPNQVGSGSALGLVGLFFLFPLCASFARKFAGMHRAELDDPRPSRLLAVLEVAVAAIVGVLLLPQWIPLRFLHLLHADYLASLLFFIGVALLLLNWRDSVASYSFRLPRHVATVALGFATILAIGGWLNWQLDDAWLNGPRWLRFAGLYPFLWIYSYAEEVMLGPVGIRSRRAWRFAFFLLLRLEVWGACAFAAYQLASGQILIVILFTFLATFSILQRLATDALRLRTGSATAAATFGAILSCWFFAAVFPLT
jgi:pimeloyl-ACP methyl ester carboxylesterase